MDCSHLQELRHVFAMPQKANAVPQIRRPGACDQAGAMAFVVWRRPPVDGAYDVEAHVAPPADEQADCVEQQIDPFFGNDLPNVNVSPFTIP